MPAPILTTKLFIPPPRSGAILRPRLIKRLNDGLQRAPGVTLISAPAGFGKTTLVSEWIAECRLLNADLESKTLALYPAGTALPRSASVGNPKFAWLALDERDNDLARFLVYLVAALQTIEPKVGEVMLSALQAAQPPPAEVLLTALLNDLTTLSDVVLVLDDYHVIESQPIDEALTFLVDHLPPQLRLVIASREDPPLPLARLRARGQLTELRAADLRCTPSEAAEFLNHSMGLQLSKDDIAALESRTEGWIAGLQLAALSMQGRSDTANFIQVFTGSHRFVLDYLMEEVLQRQPERVRSFLLQTTILERMCGPLCDTVTECGDGRGMLHTLERGNLFVVPLDDQRQWYRYHHLFADVLQARLIEEQPDRVSALHRRASVWYEQNELPAEAIQHALAATDFERAANLLERVWLAMDLSYQSATWLNWAQALPDDLIRSHPVLCLGYAWALLNGGELEASEARLRDAERWLESADNSSLKLVVVDEAEFRALPASIACARAYRALALGDIPGTIEHARRALALAAEDDHIRRTQATALLGMAEYAKGDLSAAEKSLLAWKASMWQAGDIANALGITFILANIWLAQGRLREAISAYRQVLQLAENQAVRPIGTSDLYRGLSELLCEQGDLDNAAQHLSMAQKAGESAALTGWPHRLGVAQARLQDAQGNLADALVLLEQAERQYVRNPLPDQPIAAMKARLWVRQGKLREALSWAQGHGLSPDDDLSYLREFEHLTFARVLIAQYRKDRVEGSIREGLRLLDRLLQAAEEGERTGSVIEIVMLQALAQHAQGNLPLAITSLECALTLAEAEGYVRLFVDEGEPMRVMIVDFRVWIEKQGRDQNPRMIGYADKLLTVFARSTAKPQSEISNPQSALVEPLSEREREVLRLLGTELSGPEIARELSVSLNTLRTHTKNIYGKLGVNSRRAAIRRAEELGLL